MALDSGNGWFEATGVPITPYATTSSGTNKNYYPTVKVDGEGRVTGKVLASTTTVLPVSDEITCIACHASRDPLAATPPAMAAKPAGGWVDRRATPKGTGS